MSQWPFLAPALLPAASLLFFLGYSLFLARLPQIRQARFLRSATGIVLAVWRVRDLCVPTLYSKTYLVQTCRRFLLQMGIRENEAFASEK